MDLVYTERMVTKDETVVNIHEAKTNLSKLLRRVERGEKVVIARSGTPVAKLEGYEPAKGNRVFGLGQGKVVIHDNFDDPLPDWEELTI